MAQKSDDNKTGEVSSSKDNHYATYKLHKGWLWGLAALLAVILVFMFGVAAGQVHRDDGPVSIEKGAMLGGGQQFGVRRTYGGFGTGSGGTLNSQTVIHGVVTSVSGSNFTIAGNGATTSVTTDSSTQYQNGNQVKQNDSVIVSGTSSSGTITATHVAINP